MNNTPKKIETLLQQSRLDVEIPLRSEFKLLIDDVTNQSVDRKTEQKGIKSPFILFMNFTKNKLVLAGSVALLAIIVIIPSVRHKRITPVATEIIQSQVMPTDEQSAAVIQESKGTISEDVITDIMNEFSQEDALITQELSDDGYVQIDYEIDESFTS